MKNTILFLSFIFVQQTAFAYQRINNLYVDTFGNRDEQSIIFVHGGPGHHSFDFQSNTADTLSKNGYYVVVYDQRGQGRNQSGIESDFTYDIYVNDLKSIIDELNLNNPVIIAHSHGGLISVKFDIKYPNIAKAIILTSAPLNFWSVIESMSINCNEVLSKTNNQNKISEIKQIVESLDNYKNPSYNNALDLAKLFKYGLEECNLYKASKPMPLINPNSLNEFLEKNKLENPTSNDGPFADPLLPMPSFLINENYIKVNMLDYVKLNKGKYFGIYGSDDGLFQINDLLELKDAIENPEDSKSRFSIIDGASHNVYSDNQGEFIKIINSYLK